MSLFLEIISELKELSVRRKFLYFIILFTFICPTSILIFILNKDLFTEIDILKLIIFSIGLSIPIFALNFLNILFGQGHKIGKDLLIIKVVGVTNTMLYAIIFLRILNNISIKTAVICLLLFQLVIFVIGVLSRSIDFIKKGTRDDKKQKL